MTKDELQKVRDALWLPKNSTDEEFAQFNEAFALLDRALAAPEPEPFCYVNVNAQGDVTRTIKREDKWCKTPLYRHPAPSREWQGLTDEEIKQVLRHPTWSLFDYAKAISSALRAKNSGEQNG